MRLHVNGNSQCDVSVENGRRSANDAGTIGYLQETKLNVFLTGYAQQCVFKYVNIKNKTNIFIKYICLCPVHSFSRIRKFCTCIQKEAQSVYYRW